MKEIKMSTPTKKGKIFGILAVTIIISLVISLSAAVSSMNPVITYSGYGNPNDSVGREGDLYIQLENNVIWSRRADVWEMFAIIPVVVNGTEGPIGPTGPAGADGINGTNGIDGINGTDGVDGIDGRRGSLAFYEGILEPEDTAVLFEGDSYHYLNGDVYVYNGTEWVYFTNLVGPQGEQGIQGIQGETGAAGPQGETGLTGATGATGPAGPQGEQGPAGVDGIDGVNGSAVTADSVGVLGIPWWIIAVLAAVSGLAVAISVYAVKKKRQK